MSAIVYKPSILAAQSLASRDITALTSLPRQLVKTLYAWQQRSVERRQLLEMSGQMLADIGIDRVDALQEAAKPFWKP